MTVAGVVLAAGAGRRYRASGGEGHKLLAVIDGRPVIAHVLEAVRSAGFDEVVLVQGAVDLRAHAGADVTVLSNATWADGIATSLHVAVAHAAEMAHEAVVVGLGDQPAVPVGAWRTVAAAPAAPAIAVAVYDGQRGNPVRLAAAVWPLLATTGDEGARSLMHERPELVREVPCTGQAWDVDTVEDLDRWT
jgi:CTP:molybdopterin cytidylyltransferase MocA